MLSIKLCLRCRSPLFAYASNHMRSNWLASSTEHDIHGAIVEQLLAVYQNSKNNTENGF